MHSDPTPFQRLLHLESTLEQLLAAQLSDHAIRPLHEPWTRAIWPSDELLLTRLLRRSPDVLDAYQAPAELSVTEGQGLRLTGSHQSSPFLFSELLSGDAVVWIGRSSPDWLWSSAIFRSLFLPLADGHNGDSYTVQTLPLFKPIERGQSWTLSRRGELVPQLNLVPEQAEQEQLLRRLSLLEQLNLQQRVQFESQIQELQIQVRVQQEQIDRLLKLRAVQDRPK
ncbi:MAG: hypothetical protein RL044_519 [Actinomycetota bacterium]|jgi:hypothetical protein